MKEHVTKWQTQRCVVILLGNGSERSDILDCESYTCCKGQHKLRGVGCSYHLTAFLETDPCFPCGSCHKYSLWATIWGHCSKMYSMSVRHWACRSLSWWHQVKQHSCVYMHWLMGLNMLVQLVALAVFCNFGCMVCKYVLARTEWLGVNSM